VGQIGTAVHGSFVIEDMHNFGPDYDRTLMAWDAKFQQHRPAIAAKHGERFCRMWEYYLRSCAGGFRSREISVGQFVLSPRGVRGGYRTVR
jgi:cyclopropane-fatty-acyl-phospholipid synthase